MIPTPAKRSNHQHHNGGLAYELTAGERHARDLYEPHEEEDKAEGDEQEDEGNDDDQFDCVAREFGHVHSEACFANRSVPMNALDMQGYILSDLNELEGQLTARGQYRLHHNRQIGDQLCFEPIRGPGDLGDEEDEDEDDDYCGFSQLDTIVEEDEEHSENDDADSDLSAGDARIGAVAAHHTRRKQHQQQQQRQRRASHDDDYDDDQHNELQSGGRYSAATTTVAANSMRNDEHVKLSRPQAENDDSATSAGTHTKLALERTVLSTITGAGKHEGRGGSNIYLKGKQQLEDSNSSRMNEKTNIDNCDTEAEAATAADAASNLQERKRTTTTTTTKTALSEDIVIGPARAAQTVEASGQFANNNKMPTQQQQKQRQKQQQFCQPLPSTNRLIIEHQARQQQALFRLLTERQKLMDELGAEQRDDLMSSMSTLNLAKSSVVLASKVGAGKQRRRRRRRQQRRQRQEHRVGEQTSNSAANNNNSGQNRKQLSSSSSSGVPLSVVDLSSMSDRMLDELLGQIASASSSSLSSNGESLGSSDFSGSSSSSYSYSGASCGSSDDDQDEEDANSSERENASNRESGGRRGQRHKSARRGQSSLASQIVCDHDAPSVIGIHEDERTRSNCLRQLNCRDAHRRSYDNGRERDDDDDSSKDHELVVSVNGSNAASNNSDSLAADSLSPPCGNTSASNIGLGANIRRNSNEQHQQAHKRGFFSVSPSSSLLLKPEELVQQYRHELFSRHNEAATRQPTNTDSGNSDESASNRKQLLEQFLVMLLHEVGSGSVMGAQQELNNSANLGTNQEQTNELLERVLSQFDRISNGTSEQSANSSSTMASLGATNLVGSQRQQQGNGSKQMQMLISQQKQQLGTIASSTMLLSKDSDYGSDTQSAECLSQHHQSTNSDSPSPSSLTTQTTAHSPSSSSSCSAPTVGSGNDGLTSKLDHLLRLFAQQQHRQPRLATTTVPSSASKSGTTSSGVRVGHHVTSENNVAVAADDDDVAADVEASLAAQSEPLKRQRRGQQNSRSSDSANGSENKAAGSGGRNGAATATNAATAAPSGAGKRSPMKSIVMINSTRSPSAASIVSSSSSPLLVEQQLQLSSLQRNMTPFGGEQQAAPMATTTPNQKQRHQFKTCVSIGGGNAMSSVSPSNSGLQKQVSSVSLVASLLAPLAGVSASSSVGSASSGDNKALSERTASIDNNYIDETSGCVKKQVIEEEEDEEAREHPDLNRTVLVGRNRLQPEGLPSSKSKVAYEHQVHQQEINSASVTIAGSNFVRRRSSRSSLRRRPSFNGSIASCKEPRPDSPVPRLLVSEEQQLQQEQQQQQQQALSKVDMADSSDLRQQHSEQRQLQRKLILAQKYNYSLAKCALSKLNSQLQPRDLATTNNSNKQTAEDAINGSQALNRNNGDRSTTKGEWQQQQQDPGTANTNSASCKAGQQQQQQIQLPSVQVTGKVELDISYFAKSGSLTIHVLRCAQLAPVSKRRTTSNPYVKLYLLPDKSKGGKRKSRIKKGQLNPEFNETFTFGPIQLSEFDGRTLSLSVLHKDRLGRSEFLGGLLLPLIQVSEQLLSSDLCQSTSPKWYQLQERFALGSEALKQQAGMQQSGSRVVDTNDWTGTPHHNQQLDSTMDSNFKAVTTKMHEPQLPVLSGGAGNSDLRRHLVGEQAQRSSLDQSLALNQPRQPIKKRRSILEDTYLALGLQQPFCSGRGSAVASSVGEQKRSMDVYLGPLPASVVSGNNANDSSEQQSQISGKLFVAIKFVPNNPELLSSRTKRMEGQLHVTVKEAHNIGGFESPSLAALSAMQQQQHDNSLAPSPIKPPPSGALPNPFCKCYLLDSNGQRVAKQKTAHLKRTANPRWNHTCVFYNVKLANLANQGIEIQMVNRDSILVNRNEYLGGVRLCCSHPSTHSNNTNGGDSASIASDQSAESGSLNKHFGGAAVASAHDRAGHDIEEGALSSEREARLWNQMIKRPNMWIYGELRLHQLRPLIPKPTPTTTILASAIGEPATVVQRL